MSLREAHEVMSNIERSLKLEIPNIAKVHVDPEIQDK
jgi:divalent metal cation (Fe/Co/Zn/Cd) transporter